MTHLNIEDEIMEEDAEVAVDAEDEETNDEVAGDDDTEEDEEDEEGD